MPPVATTRPIIHRRLPRAPRDALLLHKPAPASGSFAALARRGLRRSWDETPVICQGNLHRRARDASEAEAAIIPRATQMPLKHHPERMGQPAAKKGDQVVGIDTHVIMIPSPGGPIPTPMPLPCAGQLAGNLSATVKIDNQAAATKGSTANNSPQHIPPVGSFQNPPSNVATVDDGSATVFFDGQKAARLGNPAKTCNDPTDAPNGVIIASGTVVVG